MTIPADEFRHACCNGSKSRNQRHYIVEKVEKLNLSKWPKSFRYASVFTQNTYSIKICVPPVRVKNNWHRCQSIHAHPGPWDFTQQWTAILQKFIHHGTSTTWFSAVQLQSSLDKHNASLPLDVEGWGLHESITPFPWIPGSLSSGKMIIVLQDLWWQ